jgi:hypothetical protein
MSNVVKKGSSARKRPSTRPNAPVVEKVPSRPELEYAKYEKRLSNLEKSFIETLSMVSGIHTAHGETNKNLGEMSGKVGKHLDMFARNLTRAEIFIFGTVKTLLDSGHIELAKLQVACDQLSEEPGIELGVFWERVMPSPEEWEEIQKARKETEVEATVKLLELPEEDESDEEE